MEHQRSEKHKKKINTVFMIFWYLFVFLLLQNRENVYVHVVLCGMAIHPLEQISIESRKGAANVVYQPGDGQSRKPVKTTD